VTLRGKVDSDGAKAAAASVAQAVDGVKSVRNDLRVVPPGNRKAIDTSDKDITRQVEGRLAKDAQLKKVGVRTDGGRSSSRVRCRALVPVPELPSLLVECLASAPSRTS
jgi:osmotically-inducible protein OsmY